LTYSVHVTIYNYDYIKVIVIIFIDYAVFGVFCPLEKYVGPPFSSVEESERTCF
jgi:hypothetical protein